MRKFFVLLGLWITLTTGCQRSAPAPSLALELQPEKLELPGLHNVYRLTPYVYCGNTPEGDAGFESLKSLDIQSILSVDGAAPDVARAKRVGMLYAHLPVGYDGISEPESVRLAAALDQLPRPIYVHCHHGKHRGPAAAMVGLRTLSPRCDAASAVRFLEQAGTDPRYTGLYAAVNRVPSAKPEHGWPNTALPERADTPPLVASMVRIDTHFDAIKAANTDRWPKAIIGEVVLLGEAYREAARLSSDRPADFLTRLADAENAARAMETALSTNADPSAAFAQSAKACAECHAKYRDATR